MSLFKRQCCTCKSLYFGINFYCNERKVHNKNDKITLQPQWLCFLIVQCRWHKWIKLVILIVFLSIAIKHLPKTPVLILFKKCPMCITFSYCLTTHMWRRINASCQIRVKMIAFVVILHYRLFHCKNILIAVPPPPLRSSWFFFLNLFNF